MDEKTGTTSMGQVIQIDEARIKDHLGEMDSVQIISHFRSCDGGSVGLVLRRVERRHVHVLAG